VFNRMGFAIRKSRPLEAALLRVSSCRGKPLNPQSLERCHEKIAWT
jgi:hypothetical protein